jgi:hypothetical protein
MVNLGLFFWDVDHGGDVLRPVREIAPTPPRSAGVLITAQNVSDLADDAISVITEMVPLKNSPMSIMPMFHLNGGYCDPCNVFHRNMDIEPA